MYYLVFDKVDSTISVARCCTSLRKAPVAKPINREKNIVISQNVLLSSFVPFEILNKPVLKPKIKRSTNAIEKIGLDIK